MPYKRARSASTTRRVRRRYRSYRPGASKRRVLRKFKRTRMTKLIKAVTLKTCEKKQRFGRVIFNSNVTDANTKNERFILLNDGIVTGCIYAGGGSFESSKTYPNQMRALMPNVDTIDADNFRNGDEIYATGIHLKGSIDVGANFRNTAFRIWLVEANQSQGELWGTAGASAGFSYNMAWGNFDNATWGTAPMNGQVEAIYSRFFFNNDTLGAWYGTHNPLQDTIVTDNWKAQKVGTYRLKGRDLLDAPNGTIYINKWIPFKRKIKFHKNTQHVSGGMKDNFWLIIGAHNDVQSERLQPVGSVQMKWDFYYKDP